MLRVSVGLLVLLSIETLPSGWKFIAGVIGFGLMLSGIRSETRKERELDGDL